MSWPDKLRAWLTDNNARVVRSVTNGKKEHATVWRANGHLFVVLTVEGNTSVYIPASESNNIEETLKALDLYCTNTTRDK